MNNFRKKLGGKIKRMREQFGFSQEGLAAGIGINRVSLSQIENGQREVSAEELAKLAGTFNISTDQLLDLKEEIKVILEEPKEKPSKESKPKSQESRIDVPQENLKKFKEVLLYILNKVGSKPNIGETVLYKLLYFIDFDFYERYEEQLIGAKYIKNHHGPTPVEFIKIIEQMESKDLIKVKDKYFQYPQTKYLPLRKPDLRELKSQEIELIDEVLNKLSDMNATQISEYSHYDVPWLTTKDGEEIKYESVFYRTPPYSVRTDSGDSPSKTGLS